MLSKSPGKSTRLAGNPLSELPPNGARRELRVLGAIAAFASVGALFTVETVHNVDAARRTAFEITRAAAHDGFAARSVAFAHRGAAEMEIDLGECTVTLAAAYTSLPDGSIDTTEYRLATPPVAEFVPPVRNAYHLEALYGRNPCGALGMPGVGGSGEPFPTGVPLSPGAQAQS